ncbi:amidase 1-like [Cryptomeria japonica]|uniref:amidase 1-like n=1 Tax=Cryptomeria japonica TaxID=3369 RepID=UPI0027DA08ED|nr:amidase 1-like [Cryptomeria japonica]
MASSISLIVAHGARRVGKTITDELAYNTAGKNKIYGAPKNPAIALRIPWRCSSGFAEAITTKLVDFDLGTDTDGSMRISAVFCGIFGFHPSCGSVSSFVVVPMVQSLIETVQPDMLIFPVTMIFELDPYE